MISLLVECWFLIIYFFVQEHRTLGRYIHNDSSVTMTQNIILQHNKREKKRERVFTESKKGCGTHFDRNRQELMILKMLEKNTL